MTHAAPDDRPADPLIGELYDQLRLIARRERYRAGSPMTLQTTAVVNEAWLKLRRADGWESREHFIAVAATAMRHVLVDAARARLAQRRVQPQAEEMPGATEDRDVIRVGEALRTLAELDPELARLVDCRFFVGLDERETADILGMSERTLRRRWVQARAWIHRELMTDGAAPELPR